jgi:hypothetical protein
VELPELSHNFLGLVNIEQKLYFGRFIMLDMKTKELTPQQLLAVRCPTCGAKAGERCELATGQLRTTPHRDRRLVTAEFIESSVKR